MPLVQGIDGSVLLNAFRQGKRDRAGEDEYQMEMQARQNGMLRQQQTQGLLGQLFGGQQTGVVGQYAPSNPAAAPQGAPQDVLPSGGPQVPPPPQTAPHGVNPDVMRQLIMVDPEMAGKIMSSLKTMNETELTRHQERNDAMGAASNYLMKYPPAQRAGMVQHVQQFLAQAGWTPEELAHLNLSDDGLKAHIAGSMDFDKMLDNERADREFMAGKTVPVPDGGNVALVKPIIGQDGSVSTSKEWLIGGNAGGGATATGIPPEAAAALKRGEGSREQFDEMFGPGAADRVLGGGGGNATGNFRT